ncbi:hypothetical protein OAU03_00615 [Luminiphilus sp.]|nr:hypothetical protein [Luminiphilus sp.]
MKRMRGEEWASFVAGRSKKVSQTSQEYCSLEKHWHPVGLEFIRAYRDLKLPPLAFQLYVYMLIRSSPVAVPRAKNAHLFGDTIQRGEFFENKEVVADFFGKGELRNDAKINWFLRTVKPLIRMDLVQQIESGKRGCNASYIVNDVREIIPF